MLDNFTVLPTGVVKFAHRGRPSKKQVAEREALMRSQGLSAPEPRPTTKKQSAKELAAISGLQQLISRKHSEVNTLRDRLKNAESELSILEWTLAKMQEVE